MVATRRRSPAAGSLRRLQWRVRFHLWTEISARKRFIPANGDRSLTPNLEPVPFDGVIVHCFDAQKLVLALVTRPALEDYFGFPRIDGDRRPSITQCVTIVSNNIQVFSEIISRKYVRRDYRMLDRYGSTHPFIQISYRDIKAS